MAPDRFKGLSSLKLCLATADRAFGVASVLRYASRSGSPENIHPERGALDGIVQPSPKTVCSSRDRREPPGKRRDRQRDDHDRRAVLQGERGQVPETDASRMPRALFNDRIILAAAIHRPVHRSNLSKSSAAVLILLHPIAVLCSRVQA